MQATQFSKGLESLDTAGPFPRPRSASISSDSQGSTRMSLLSPPATVDPSPAYVSVTAASEVVRSSQAYLIGTIGDENAHATPGAMSLLNGFLDHLLFNILAAAKSVRLARIRTAVTEVFRPHLARELTSLADSELSEYVGDMGPNVESADVSPNLDGAFELGHAWKLARLRCMIYTRLGDLEEEDEDDFISREALEDGYNPSRKFGGPTTIAPTTAIFLTAIIEYIAEQSLAIAGQAAYARLSEQEGNDDDDGDNNNDNSNNIHDRHLVVQECDMEKLALNTTLGRLWRTWRKLLRSPGLFRTFSRDSVSAVGPYRRSSSSLDGKVQFRPEPDPCSVPLPPSPIPEVEQEAEPQTPSVNEVFGTPRSTADPEFEVVAMKAIVAHKVRPRSLMVLPSAASQSSTSSSDSNPSSLHIPKGVRHVRSKSLPDKASKVEDLGISAPDLRREDAPPVLSHSRSPSLERQLKQKHLSTMFERDESPSPSGDNELKVPGSLPAEPSKPAGVDGARETQDVQESAARATSPTAAVGAETVREPGAATPDGEGAEKAKIGFPSTEALPSSSSDVPEGEEKKPIANDVTDKPVEDHRDPPASRIGEIEKAGEEEEEEEEEEDLAGAGYAIVQAPSEDAASDIKPRDFAKTVRAGEDSANEEGSFTALAISDSSAKSVHPVMTPNRDAPWPLTEPTVNFSKVVVTAQHSRRQSSTATSPGVERAAVQRLSSQASANSTNSRPDSPSSTMEKRVGTGKLKGLIGRSSQHHESPTKGMRSSSDTSRGSLASRDQPDEKSALDRLIYSDETIHFTLTPKNMRDMEVSARDIVSWIGAAGSSSD